MSAATDREVLRHAAYDADDDLRVRRETHERYTEGEDFHDWVLRHLPRQPGDALLDVGCGPGDFLARLRAEGHTGPLAGCDLSEGMVRTAHGAAPALGWFVADAQALPFEEDQFDGTLARHMLYHVPDIPRAVAELARVTRRGGWLAVATNARGSMRAIFEVYDSVRHPQLQVEEPISARFYLEEATDFLRPHFTHIRTLRNDSALVLPSPEPLRAFVASARHLIMAPSHTDADWVAVRYQLWEAADHIWARDAVGGLLRIPKAAGLVLVEGRKT